MPTISFNQYFPGYEILGELGRSNARVLKARNQLTGELVAIKHFSINTEPETLRRFQRESEIMTSVKNPYIVKIKEVRLDADLPYIVMELIEGGDLRNLLKEKGTLDVASTIRLGLQMVQAFKTIHEKDIIHRDFKPENIMYRYLSSDEFHFLLTDFGIAKLREQSHTVTGTSMMTYEYGSPEQFDNPKNVSTATDYYSMGVVLYECLTGHVPFVLGDDGVYPFTQKVIHQPPLPLQLPNNEFLPPMLDTLIGLLLAKKPGERMKDPETVRRMLKLAELEEPGQPASVVNVPKPAAVAPVTPVAKKTVSYAASAAPVTKTEPAKTHHQPAVYKEKTSNLPIVIIGLCILAAVMIIISVNKGNQTASYSDKQPDESAVFPVDSSSSTSTIADTTVSKSRYDTLMYNNGMYSGEVEDHLANGHGTRDWDNGDRYTGDWVRNQKHGKGIYYYKLSGDRYEGEFVRDRVEGAGIYYFSNGDVYDGNWENNNYNGIGTFTAKEDRTIANCPGCKTYKGFWINGLKEGFGQCYDADDRLLYQGQFQNNAPVDEYPNRGNNAQSNE